MPAVRTVVFSELYYRKKIVSKYFFPLQLPAFNHDDVQCRKKCHLIMKNPNAKAGTCTTKHSGKPEVTIPVNSL